MKRDLEEAPPTLAQAQENLERLSTLRAQLIARQIDLAQRLETAELDAGRGYLRGDRSGLQEAGALAAELKAVQRALDLLDDDQKLAETDLQRATAADLRNQAQQKRSELERLEGITQKLLVKLSEAEGVMFDSSVLSSQPQRFTESGLDAWLNPMTLKRPEPWMSILELTPGELNTKRPIAIPRSRLLRREIDELELRASEIEHKLNRRDPEVQVPAPRAVDPSGLKKYSILDGSLISGRQRPVNLDPAHSR